MAALKGCAQIIPEYVLSLDCLLQIIIPSIDVGSVRCCARLIDVGKYEKCSGNAVVCDRKVVSVKVSEVVHNVCYLVDPNCIIYSDNVNN